MNLITHEEKDKEIERLRILVNDLSKERSELERTVEKWKKWQQEVYTRQRCQLMSIWYFLDAINKGHTHRQKETVIMCHKQIIQDMIQQGDPLPIDFERNELPF
jgi:predicted glycoside hydrolase/deacetylase ChbG (UPF0249 family)